MLSSIDDDLLKYGSVEPHIRQRVLKFKDEQAKWVTRLFRMTSKEPLNLTNKQENKLLNILKQIVQDDVECVRAKATQTMANIAANSETFAIKIMKKDILRYLLHNFIASCDVSRRAVLSIVGSYSRVCDKEEGIIPLLELRIADFMTSCVTSTDDTMIGGAADAMVHMVRHPRIMTEIISKGSLLRLMALLLLDDLDGKLSRTRPLLALLRRLSERRGVSMSASITSSGCLACATRLIYQPDIVLQRLALGVLMNVAMVSMDHVAPLLSPTLIADVVSFMITDDPELKYCATHLVRKIAESSKDRLRVLLENGALEALLLAVQTARYCGDPTLTTLASVLRRSPTGATERFLQIKGHLIVANLIYHDCCETMLVCAMQVFYEVYKRGEPYCNIIANTNIYPRLSEIYKKPDTPRVVRSLITNVMSFIQDSTDWNLITTFYYESLNEHAKFALKPFSEVLYDNIQEKRNFIDCGGLCKMEHFELSEDDPISEYRDLINSYYPEDIVNYHSTKYIPGAVKNLHEHDPEAELKKYYRKQMSEEEVSGRLRSSYFN